jgi:uncharacterized membrane protein YhfC
MLAAGAERQLKITTLIHSKVDTAVDVGALCYAARLYEIAVPGHGLGVVVYALLSTIVCQ